MRIGQVTPLLNLYLEHGVSLLLSGPPGAGKTSVVKQEVKKLIWEEDGQPFDFDMTHPVTADPVDYKGIPWVDKGLGYFLPFGFLKKLVDAKRPLVVLIDDLGQASQMVQAAIMQLVLERRIDDKMVSPHVRFVACTNRKEDMAGVATIIEPLKTRFVILEVEPSFDDWRVNWAEQNGISAEIIAFFNFKRELFHKFEPSEDIKNHPNPRTIEFLDKVYKLIKDKGLSLDIEQEAYAGCVGNGCALEFRSFLEVLRSVPDPKYILDNPDKVDIPKNQSVCYSIVSAFAEIVDEDTLPNAFKYIGRMKKDFSGVFASELKKRRPEVVNTSAFVSWAVKYNAS